MRVLSALHRRRWLIVSVPFELVDPHRPATRRRLRARPTGERPGAMETWLAGLPDMLEIRRER